MPGIDTVFKIILELIQALNPSELEKLQKEISVKQKEIDKKRKEWENDKEALDKAFVDPMDIPAINRIFAKWSDLLQP